VSRAFTLGGLGLALGAWFAFAPERASAADYYVQRGSGCLQGHPTCGVDVAGREFDDVDQCAERLQPGDTCWIKNGTYSRGIDSANGRPYQPLVPGTPGARITFRNYPGHRPLFQSSSIWELGVRTQLVHYVTYSGLAIEGVLAIVGTSEGARVRGIVVEGCEITRGGGKDDGNWSGIFVQWAEDVVIRDNVIRDVNTAPSRHGQKGISIFNGRRTLVEHNFIANNPDEGIFDKEGGEDNVYRRNVFSNNGVHLKLNNQADDTGLQNVRSQVYENLFLGGSEGVRALVQPSDWRIDSNTFVDTTGVVVRSNSGPAPGGEVTDNLFFRSGLGHVHFESWNGDDREPVVMNWNLFTPGGVFRENRFSNTREFTGLAAWRSVPHPRLYDANSIESDPRFVDAAHGNYHLASDSPGRGAGRNGNDIGAYPRGNDGTVLGPRALPVVIPPPPGDTAPPPPSGGGSSASGGECASWVTRHPEWIFCDDFEDASFASRYPGSRFEDGSDDRPSGSGLPSIVWSQTEAATGSASLEVDWEPGQVEAGHLFAHFGRNPLGSEVRNTENFREIYWRFRIKLQNDFVGLPSKLTRATSFGSTTSWAQAMIAHLWRSASGDRLALDPVSGVDAASALRTTIWNDFANFTWLGSAAGATPIPSGRWVCIEAHVRLDDPGASNGLFEFWVDDHPEAQRSGLRFVGAWADYGINAVMLETRYGDSGSPVAQKRWMDSFVVSTARIGCASAEPPPASVTVPFSLEGTAPESAALAINGAAIPSEATHAYLWLDVFDADYPDEGRLVVNSRYALPLFGSRAHASNDGRDTELEPLVLDRGWFTNGTNTLVFHHDRTGGFRVDGLELQFLPDGGGGDRDADGVANPGDNCLVDPNPSQLDRDGDGIGNRCDADLDQSGYVDFRDLFLLRLCRGNMSYSACAAGDLDEDGDIDDADVAGGTALESRGPGPSGSADQDRDGRNDFWDNCTLRGNPAEAVDADGRVMWLQRDVDADGYGNACDGDLDDSGYITYLDLKAMASCFNAPPPGQGPAIDPNCAESDMDGSGSVSIRDAIWLRSRVTPGPSALR
jgi:hypothetical protein